MAFQSGTTVDPRLMQHDYSGYERAGAAEGQAMSNFGKSIASGIEGYKKKKKEQNAGKARIKRAEALGDSMIAMVKDKNPDLANSIAETMSMNFDEGVPFAQRMEATEGFEQSLMNMFLMDQKNQAPTYSPIPGGGYIANFGGKQQIITNRDMGVVDSPLSGYFKDNPTPTPSALTPEDLEEEARLMRLNQ